MSSNDIEHRVGAAEGWQRACEWFALLGPLKGEGVPRIPSWVLEEAEGANPYAEPAKVTPPPAHLYGGLQAEEDLIDSGGDEVDHEDHGG